jgi:soluble P-type ATPase
MIPVTIPGRGSFRLLHLVLDVNGTLAEGGALVPGVRERLVHLTDLLEVHWVTADTRGRQSALDAELGWPAVRIQEGAEAQQKAAFVQELGARSVVAIGNGANDAAMLRTAALGLAVLGSEGLAVEALLAADALLPSITQALDLLQDPQRLVATLRR